MKYYYQYGKTGFQTDNGIRLTPACWDEAWLLDDTRTALVRNNKTISIMDVYSGDLIALDCDKADQYGDRLLRLRRKGKFGLCDFAGKTIIPAEYDLLTNHHGQFNIIVRNCKYGLLNAIGGFAKPMIFDIIFPVCQRGVWRMVCIRNHQAIYV